MKILHLYDPRDTKWNSFLEETLLGAGYYLRRQEAKDYDGLGEDLPDIVIQSEPTPNTAPNSVLTKKVVEDSMKNACDVSVIVFDDPHYAGKDIVSMVYQSHLAELGEGAWRYCEKKFFPLNIYDAISSLTPSKAKPL